MSTNLLTPESGLGRGILHRNSMSVAAEGPWSFVSVTWGDAVDGPSDGEASGPQHRPRGGTCEVCGASIINIVDARNRPGRQITVGVDCAETLWKNQSDRGALAAFKLSLTAHERSKREAAKARRMARNATHNLANCSEALVTLDALGALPPSYARSFGLSVARDLRAGRCKGLTGNQAACMERLAGENLTV